MDSFEDISISAHSYAGAIPGKPQIGECQWRRPQIIPVNPAIDCFIKVAANPAFYRPELAEKTAYETIQNLIGGFCEQDGAQQ
jgi:hypothetical protein